MIGISESIEDDALIDRDVLALDQQKGGTAGQNNTAAPAVKTPC